MLYLLSNLEVFKKLRTSETVVCSRSIFIYYAVELGLKLLIH